MNIKAKPTKFNGILYRSKSEAMLAVCFDEWGWKFQYEPPISARFKPDFAITHRSGNIRFIEYKPIRPKDKYIDELWVNYKRVLLHARSGTVKVRCEMWCLDFWHEKYVGYRFNEDCIDVFSMEKYDFSPGKDFRFDLHDCSDSKVDLSKIV